MQGRVKTSIFKPSFTGCWCQSWFKSDRPPAFQILNTRLGSKGRTFRKWWFRSTNAAQANSMCMDQWWDSPPLQIGISSFPACSPAIIEIVNELLACLIIVRSLCMLLFVKLCSLVCLSCRVLCVWLCSSADLIFIIKSCNTDRAVAVQLRQKKLSRVISWASVLA